MDTQSSYAFSGPVNVFQERRLPETATLAGYSALIEACHLAVPPPHRLFAISSRHHLRDEARWRLLTPRHAPPPTLEGHLTFALKHEGLDLAVLKRLFQTVGPRAIAALVRDKPTGAYARRLWFLYEWLLGEPLDLPDAPAGRYVPVVDPRLQWATPGETSTRHRVWNNLPGTPAFCPMIFRTPRLEEDVAGQWHQRAVAAVAAVPRDLLTRAAAFLLVSDSRASFTIEGERPPQDRISRWGRAIGEAGRRPLDEGELLRLQKLVIGDARFVTPGLRTGGGFVGTHDRETHQPMPDHVSARPEDLPSLLSGLFAFAEGPSRRLDPVMAAAALAFGFVYIHPFEDGNGRVHRYLIHHVLAGRGFHPPGIVFPVSAAILGRLDEYRDVLESHSARILPWIDWEPTGDFNVRVRNDTADLYRFFDATPHAEFLYACVRKTIVEDLPDESAFLRAQDRFAQQVRTLVDMPERTIHLLYRFLNQNGGRLSQRARSQEFSALTDDEAARIEGWYRELFGAP